MHCNIVLHSTDVNLAWWHDDFLPIVFIMTMMMIMMMIVLD